MTYGFICPNCGEKKILQCRSLNTHQKVIYAQSVIQKCREMFQLWDV